MLQAPIVPSHFQGSLRKGGLRHNLVEFALAVSVATP